jgi:hypothetical protein
VGERIHPGDQAGQAGSVSMSVASRSATLGNALVEDRHLEVARLVGEDRDLRDLVPSRRGRHGDHGYGAFAALLNLVVGEHAAVGGHSAMPLPAHMGLPPPSATTASQEPSRNRSTPAATVWTPDPPDVVEDDERKSARSRWMSPSP